jgi:hypothetical protein
MNWGSFTRVALGIALAVGVIALGTSVYQAGFTAGVATEGSVAVAPAPVYAGYGWGVHWGFPFFGFFGFLLFLFLLFGLFRLIFWGGRGRGRGYGYGPGPGWGNRGRDHDHGADATSVGDRGGSTGSTSTGSAPWEGRAHSVFDEWHRQAHDPNARPATPPPPDDTATR